MSPLLTRLSRSVRAERAYQRALTSSCRRRSCSCCCCCFHIIKSHLGRRREWDAERSSTTLRLMRRALASGHEGAWRPCDKDDGLKASVSNGRARAPRFRQGAAKVSRPLSGSLRRRAAGTGRTAEQARQRDPLSCNDNLWPALAKEGPNSSNCVMSARAGARRMNGNELGWRRAAGGESGTGRASES